MLLPVLLCWEWTWVVGSIVYFSFLFFQNLSISCEADFVASSKHYLCMGLVIFTVAYPSQDFLSCCYLSSSARFSLFYSINLAHIVVSNNKIPLLSRFSNETHSLVSLMLVFAFIVDNSDFMHIVWAHGSTSIWINEKCSTFCSFILVCC